MSRYQRGYYLPYAVLTPRDVFGLIRHSVALAVEAGHKLTDVEAAWLEGIASAEQHVMDDARLARVASSASNACDDHVAREILDPMTRSQVADRIGCRPQYVSQIADAIGVTRGKGGKLQFDRADVENYVARSAKGRGHA